MDWALAVASTGDHWDRSLLTQGSPDAVVQDARHRLWQPTPQAESLDALNLWLEERRKALWQDIPHGIEPGSVADAWADEAACLMPVGRPFDGFVEYGKRVYPDRFLVVAEGQVICEHLDAAGDGATGVEAGQ